MSERLLLAGALLGAVLLAAWLVRAWSAARVARLSANAAVETGGRPRLLLFTSAACEACVTQKRIVERLRAGWHDRVEVAIHDAVQDGALARQFGIAMVPAVVVAAPDGRVVGVKQGLVDEDRLRSLLDAAV